MLLRVTPLIGQEGASLPFSASFDWRDVEINRQYPLTQPVAFEGRVRNAAGMLLLTGTVATVLHWECDRCADVFDRLYSHDIELMLADQLTDEENDEIYLLKDDLADLSEIALTSMLLNMEMKVLCDPDCEGLDPSFYHSGGADPRWETLKRLMIND